MLAMILTLDITGFFFYKSTLHTGLRKKKCFGQVMLDGQIDRLGTHREGPNFCQQVLYILV